MSDIIVKKDKKPKKNIGGHSPFGMNIDPDNKLCLTEDKEKGQQAYYKGTKMDYMDYNNEVFGRLDDMREGKIYKQTDMGMFSGINFDKDGNIIES
mgnify:CR=1 FL=1|tara:strand:- start:192 stop:479 length:288 start_codon:yes stop_codon:yes gene_type:complete